MSGPDDQFRREATDQCRTLTNGLIDLERGEADVADLFRTAHSLKGSCRSVGLSEAGDIAHAVETLFEAVRTGQVAPDPSLVDDAIDAVATLEGEIDGGAEESPAAVARRLESAIETHHEAGTESDNSAMDVAPPDGDAAEYDDDMDPDVIEALESASEFDDLDALLDEADDSTADEGMGSWGLLNEADAEGDEPDSAPDSEPDPSSVPDDPTAYFRRTKDDRAVDDLEELQSDIEDISFGEFDDDDDMAISDLLEIESDEGIPDTMAAESEPADAAEPTPAASDASADEQPAADVDASPTPDVDATTDVEPAITEVDTADTPPDTAATATESTDEPPTEPEVEPAITEVESAAGEQPTAAETTSSDETAADTPSVDTVPTGTEAADADAADPTPQPDAPAAGDAADADEPATADADVDEGTEPVATDDETGTTAPDAPTAETPVDDEPSVEDLLAEADEQTESAAADVGSEPPLDAEGDLLEDIDIGTASDDPSTADASPLDDVSMEASNPEAEMDVRMDSELTEFGGDLDGLLDVDPTAFSVPGRAAPTIEASALDADRFRSPASTGPSEPAELNQEPLTIDPGNADRLLSLAEELSLVEMRLDAVVGDTADAATSEVLDQFSALVGEYQRTMMDVRLTPLERAVERLPAVARDAARDQNKEVRVELEGTDVRLDRSIVDRLGDPLGHLVRNAVTHGIESPHERERVGKPETGVVTVSAERVRDNVVIEVSDDGTGVDLDAVRDRAVQAGLIEAGTARALDRDGVIDLLFESGLSTATEVTEVAGRGVGMDAVAGAVERMDGNVSIETTPGEGTTIRLTLPVSVTLTEVMVVRVGDQQFAIPLSAIDQVSSLPEPRVDGDRELVRRADLSWGVDPAGMADVSSDYPLIRVSQAFDLPGKESQLLWFRPEVGDVAAAVDEVIDTREVVIRPYGDVLGRSAVVSGAATVGDGETVNVLDPEALAGIA